MHIDAGLVLLQQHPSLFGAVVGTAEQGRQSNHIYVLHAALIGIQIGLRRGAGGGRSLLTLLHRPEQVGLVKGIVIHKGTAIGVNGQRHLDKAGIFQHLSGQVAAAVHNNLKTHVFHLQM